MKQKDYEVRYDPPWRHGERDARYYVFPAPRLIQRWWRLTDPVDREIQRFQMSFGLFFDLFFSVATTIGAIYLFAVFVFPVVADAAKHWLF